MNKKQKSIIRFNDNAFVDNLEKLLMKHGKVKVSGLGIFEVREVAEREGYNVADGGRIMVPAHNRIAFRPTKRLRDNIQEYGT